jgi:hypothetical protein
MPPPSNDHWMAIRQSRMRRRWQIGLSRRESAPGYWRADRSTALSLNVGRPWGTAATGIGGYHRPEANRGRPMPSVIHAAPISRVSRKPRLPLPPQSLIHLKSPPVSALVTSAMKVAQLLSNHVQW